MTIYIYVCVCVCVCVTESLCYTPKINIINQLYSSKIKAEQTTKYISRLYLACSARCMITGLVVSISGDISGSISSWEKGSAVSTEYLNCNLLH